MRLSHPRWPAAVCAIALLPVAAVAQTRVGNAAAVVPAVTGASRTLQVGDSVFFNEVIRATAAGETRLVFLDKTSLTVGSGSTVTIDRFVYDANAGQASQFALTLTKGSFRFISGSSPKDAYEIKTPTATLGVRGTNFLVRITPGYTSLSVDDGEVVACNRKVRRDLVKELPLPRDKNCAPVEAGNAATVYADGRITNQGVGLDGVDPGAKIREAELNGGAVQVADAGPSADAIATARELSSTIVTSNVSEIGSVGRIAQLPAVTQTQQQAPGVVANETPLQGTDFTLTQGDPATNFSRGTSFGSITANGQVITALNQANLPQTSMEATFTLPPNRSIFDLGTLANFVTTEFPNFVGSQFNDNATITVISPSGTSRTFTSQQLFQASVNGSALTPVTGLPAPLQGYNPNNGGGQTGFKQVNLLSRAAPGGTVRVVVSVYNVGDTAFPSAILLAGTRGTAR